MEARALIFDIKRDCSEDGPGIRTTVFFKGCPLACVWCQNPEGINKGEELLFDAAQCHPERCGAPCVEKCNDERVIRIEAGQLVFDREQSNRYEALIKECPNHAFEPAGYWIGLDELLYRVMIDKPFYNDTGGGVTLSGGEATQQMAFCQQFLKALRAEGIETALETSGFFNYRRFREEMLPHLTLIYFDIKFINDPLSRRYTGQSNRLILDNFRRLLEDAEIPVIPRVPLIPGITDSAENLGAIARFLDSLGVEAATLLPYNPLWRDKAEKIGRPLSYDRTSFMTEAEKEEAVARFTTKSIKGGKHHAN